ncbi:MAG: hypothetical protein SCALA702_31160 [Melioribacteraceae bacterium]|nr:MAG: hypothetical protein SCALA702_31160 [Melioribacteraceae bacterium]
MRYIISLLFLIITNITAQDISFDWQRAEDFHNAGQYDSVLVHMPPVEQYLFETGFEKQRMVALFYLANANTYLHNFSKADSLYKIAISLAETTGETYKWKEIQYRRLQIQTEIINEDSLDSVITLNLLNSNIEIGSVLGITDVLVSSLYEKAKYFSRINDRENAYETFEQILYFLNIYLPRSPLFERRVFFDILDNYVKSKKFDKVAFLLKYEIFKRKQTELKEYVSSLEDKDEIAFKVMNELLEKGKTGQ